MDAIAAAGGLLDAYRHLHPDDVQHMWWNYRQGLFHRGLGLRIDLALVSDSLAPRLRHCGIERNYRKGKKPSDHAPLVVDLPNGAATIPTLNGAARYQQPFAPPRSAAASR